MNEFAADLAYALSNVLFAASLVVLLVFVVGLWREWTPFFKGFLLFLVLAAGGFVFGIASAAPQGAAPHANLVQVPVYITVEGGLVMSHQWVVGPDSITHCFGSEMRWPQVGCFVLIPSLDENWVTVDRLQTVVVAEPTES